MDMPAGGPWCQLSQRMGAHYFLMAWRSTLMPSFTAQVRGHWPAYLLYGTGGPPCPNRLTEMEAGLLILSGRKRWKKASSSCQAKRGGRRPSSSAKRRQGFGLLSRSLG
eukprot:644597-Pelagomonas_calceolata.AAC.4